MKDAKRNPLSGRGGSETVHEAALAFDCNLFVHLSEFSIQEIVAEAAVDMS